MSFDHISLCVSINHPYKLLFLAAGGFHAYGYATVYTPYDIRGIHTVSINELLGLNDVATKVEDQLFGDYFSTYEIKYFLQAMLQGKVHILEDLYIPLVNKYSPFYDDLQNLSKGCLTKACARSYKSWAFESTITVPTNLLHRYRCLLTGRYLLRSGHLLLDLPSLAEEYNCGRTQSLLQQVQRHVEITKTQIAYHCEHIKEFAQKLDNEIELSALPEQPTSQTYQEFKNFLLELRLEDEAHGTWLSSKYHENWC